MKIGVFILLLGSSSLFLGAGIDNSHDWGDDFAAYIMQARSLVDGTSSAWLASNRIAMEGSSFPSGPIAYPWGYPVLLAPLYILFGVNMLAFKSINIICYLLFLALLWFAWPRSHSNIGRFVFVSLFAWNPYFQESMNQVLSDIPFLLFSTGALVLICRVAAEQPWLFSKLWDHMLLGLVIAAACFIRTNGFLLVLTLALTLFIHAMQTSPRAHEVSLRSVLGVTLYLGILVWHVHWSNRQYFFPMDLNSLTLSVVFERFHYYIDLPPRFFAGVPHPALVYGATVPFAIAGMFQRRNLDYPMIAYGVLTVLLYVLIMPPDQGLRYLFPLLPLYIHFVLVGLEQSVVVTNQKPIVPRILVRLLPAFLILVYFAETSTVNATIAHAEKRATRAGPYLPTSQQMFSFISTKTEPDSVIVFFKPRVMKLFADRQSIMINDATALIRGDYLCVYLREDSYNQVRSDDLAQHVEDGQLSLVYQSMDFRVYHINKQQRRL